MSQYLPIGSFESEIKLKNLDIRNIPDDATAGFILEVHLEYSQECHNLYEDLSACPGYFVPPLAGYNKPKLMTTLFPKERYIIHYRNLKQCLDLGLKWKKLHRILEFQQSTWLKQYIVWILNYKKNLTMTLRKFLINWWITTSSVKW